MPYDYGRSIISKATGLTGVQAGHIAAKLKEINVDPQAIDWGGAISDAADYGDRYDAVKRYIFSYYGIDIMTNAAGVDPMFAQQGLEDLTSTKKGVKTALKTYFNSATKQEKAAIKDMLLNDNQMQLVLMTALYDGAEMPLAKQFLNEAMGKSVLPIPQKPVIPKIAVETEWIGGIEPTFTAAPANGTNGPNGNNGKPKIPKKPWAEQLRETETAKSIAKALPEVEKGIEQNLKAVAAQLKSSLSPKRERIAGLKGQIQQLRSQNEPLRLQLEYQRLLHQRQQLQQLKQMHSMQARPNPMKMMLAHMIGMPMQQPQMPVMRPALEKPGHYIEFQPKLPAGYRWKKVPTGRKRKKRKK